MIFGMVLIRWLFNLLHLLASALRFFHASNKYSQLTTGCSDDPFGETKPGSRTVAIPDSDTEPTETKSDVPETECDGARGNCMTNVPPDDGIDITLNSSRNHSTASYSSAREYLSDELLRVSFLVKAYIVRRAAAEGTERSSCDEVSQTPFRWESTPTEKPWQQTWLDQLEESDKCRAGIAKRLIGTQPELVQQFPLIQLMEIIKSDTRLTGDDHATRFVTLQRDFLLVTFLAYHCPVYRNVFSKLSVDDGTTPGTLTMGMLAEICQPRPETGSNVLEAFQTNVPLLRDRYVQVGESGIEASHRRLQIDPAIASFLLDRTIDDPELLGLTTRLDCSVSWERVLADEETLRPLHALSRRLDRVSAVVLFHGPEGGPYVSAARAVLSGTKVRWLLVADVSRAIALTNWEEWTTRVYRQARLHGSAILWDGVTAIIEASRNDFRWQQLMRSRRDMPVFMTSETSWDPDKATSNSLSTFARIEFPVPSREVRRSIWIVQLEKARFSLPAAQVAVALDLLSSFQFTEGQVNSAIMIARGLFLTDDSKRPDIPNHLYAACRRVSARGVVSFTQRIPPRKFGYDANPLDAVVLAPEGRQQFQELNNRIENMNRVYYEYGFGSSLCLGRGLIALFSGPSGTGKTMAATVLASCRERDLYKVDMSAVVSKYVGETEKNLARVFSDAQSTNALLFFDEADAIFGKRGEIDKAQDRWANMEINYLLQRVEEFSGVVILATNLKQNIDDAFLRRVQVLIDFKPPDAKDRQKILAAMFPADVIPPEPAELKSYCEQFELTGGNLKNIAVDAAFRAIQEQSESPSRNPTDEHSKLTVTIDHLVLAAAREYRKLSRPVSVSSFGRSYYEIVKKQLLLD